MFAAVSVDEPAPSVPVRVIVPSVHRGSKRHARVVTLFVPVPGPKLRPRKGRCPDLRPPVRGEDDLDA
jgi:hypothetical protein